MTTILGATLLISSMYARIGAAQADTAVNYQFEIREEPLTLALKQFAQMTNQQIIFTEALVDGKTAPAIKGEYTAQEALRKLLEGTGLTAERSPSGALMVRRLNANSGQNVESESGGVRLAQLSTEASGATPGRAATDEGSARIAKLEEIVVTAQKRAERLQDVPVPVTAVSTDALVTNDQMQLRDYYSKVPGLNLTSSGVYDGSIISIRGIKSSVFDGGTTSVVIDDVSYGNSSATGPGLVVPELDPNDLARIEVLRGPQGTLYGAMSMGGLLKYVTIDPSTDDFSGRATAGVSSVFNGEGSGYNLSGVVNVPVSDNVAIRASAFTRHDPGYIDDPVHHLDGVNWGEVFGSRVAALWRLSQDWSLKLAASYQDAESHGNSYITALPGSTTLPDLEQYTVPNSGGDQKKLQVYTANLTGSLGTVKLNVISAYIVNRSTFFLDDTAFFTATAKRVYSVTGAPVIQQLNNDKFTQEVRFSQSVNQRIDWLAGLFYDHENSPQNQRYYAADFTTGDRVGQIGYLNFPVTFREYAAFADLTYHFTDQFNIQVGGRESHNDQTAPSYTGTGPQFGNGVSLSERGSDDSSFTYLVTPQWIVSPHLMVYSRLASGYRPGGININANAQNPNVPVTYGPDKTQNYEIGTKGDVLERLLSFDTSVYYIKWQDVQIGLIQNGISFKTNAAQAKSQGVDLSVELRPAEGLTISAWGAWNLAALTQALPPESPLRAADGDRLPFSARFSGNLSMEQQFPLWGDTHAFVGASASYVGDRKGPFTATAKQQDLPAYWNTDLHAGVRTGSWEISAYANNVGDTRGLLNGGTGSTIPNTWIYTRPRTVGVTVTNRF